MMSYKKKSKVKIAKQKLKWGAKPDKTFKKPRK